MIERDEPHKGQAQGEPSEASDFAALETKFIDEARSCPLNSTIKPSLPSLCTSAKELADRIRERSFVESAYSLRRANEYLLECRTEPCVDSKVTQVGDLALLPTKGRVCMFSDLEGNIDDLVSALDEHRILARLRANDPDDQVFLCILGDSIDRSRTSSVLMEFLFELKCAPEFSRNIVILSGNHELSMDVQSCSDKVGDPRNRLGLRDEVLLGRESYQKIDLNHEETKALASLRQQPRWKSYRALQETPNTETKRAHEARVGMWLRFNDIFQLLPKMIISGNGLCAAHAGFPARRPFSYPLEAATSLSNEEKREVLLAITDLTDTRPKRPECHPFNRALDDILWSDIDPTLDDKHDAPLLGNNKRGPGGTPGPGVAWGHRALERFSEISGTTLFIRGHQAEPPSHPDVILIANGAWRYKTCVTINSSATHPRFVSLDLSIEAPSPEHLNFHAPLIDV
jgi:hypothetical protein